MAVVEVSPRIVVDPEIRFGKPVIQGTRVPVEVVVGKMAGGMSAAEVAEEYDLALKDVFAALGYAATLVIVTADSVRVRRGG